jgi:hypothetical protein
MAKHWISGNLSILAIPDQELFDSFLPMIKEWTYEGLLGPFMILGPSSYQKIENRPPKVEVVVFGLNEQNDVEELKRDLFASLASQEWRMVRLLALHQITDEWTTTKCNWAVLNDIADQISNVLPLAGTRATAAAGGTVFRKMNLVVAQAQRKNDGIEDVLNQNWDLNIFASPEDRSNPWSPDAMIEDGERLAMFSLVHAASVGAMWEGIPVGPYDTLDSEGGVTGKIYISRSFVSAIVTDSLARRVAAKTLSTIGLAPEDLFSARLGVAIPGTQVVPPQDVPAYKQWMVDQIFSLDNGFLQFKSSGALDEPPKLRWYELQQLLHFLKFSGNKLGSVPRWAYLAIRRKLGRKMTKSLHGADGLAQIGVDQEDALDRRDRQLILALQQTNLEAQNARRAMSAPYSKRGDGQIPASVSLWGGIRRIFFGLLDGSRLDDFGISQENGPLPVFSGLNAVVQDPDDELRFPINAEPNGEEVLLRWTDASQARDHIESLSSLRKQLLDEQNAKRIQITEIENQLRDMGVDDDL